MVASLAMTTALLAITAGEPTPPRGAEQEVGRAVQSFYDAFNSHDFAAATEFATDDWVHINPLGGATEGRAAVLQELHEVHATFLKGVVDTPEAIKIRFATADVAIATVPSRVSSYTLPDGSRHENERQIRTFVVVKRSGRWRIMQDQNTIRVQ